MKRKMLLFLFITCVAYANAQTWFPDGAKWYYEMPRWYNPDPKLEIREYHNIKDTLLYGQNVKTIEVTFIQNNTRSVIDTVYVYEENNRVYYLDSIEYKLMYDFNLTKGDTLQFEIKDQFETCEYNDAIAIDTVYEKNITDNYSIKIQELRYTSDEEERSNSYIVAEKIGGYNFIFNPIPSCVALFGSFEIFTCYEDTEIALDDNYNVVPSCASVINNIEEIEPEYEMSFYPNPAQNSLFWKYSKSGTSDFAIEIKDVIGNRIYYEDTISVNEGSIDVSDYPSGIYFLSTYRDKFNVKTHKIVKR